MAMLHRLWYQFFLTARNRTVSPSLTTVFRDASQMVNLIFPLSSSISPT